MRTKFYLAALAATVGATPAFAQAVPVTDSDSAEAHGRVLTTHSLKNITPLNFGTVVADSTNAGTVTVEASAAGGATPDSNGYVTVIGATSSAAEFDGLAAPGEGVLLTLDKAGSKALTLSSGTNTITGTLALDSNGSQRTGDVNTGAFTAYVGGTFDIAAKQPNGYYVGTFKLTAEYQ